MNEKERLQLENELLLTCSKAQAINKYIDELEESSKLSELWCKSQQENKILRENAEHNDKVVDDVNWKNRLLKQENQQLKEVIEEVREEFKKSLWFFEQLIDENNQMGFRKTEYKLVNSDNLLKILDKGVKDE